MSCTGFEKETGISEGLLKRGSWREGGRSRRYVQKEEACPFVESDPVGVCPGYFSTLP